MNDTLLQEFTFLGSNCKTAIESYKIFAAIEESISNNDKILDIIREMEKLAISSAKANGYPAPSMGSINNCNGRWFELVFFKAFREYAIKNKFNIQILKLPSASLKAKFHKLFLAELSKALDDIEPATSNPDFLILSGVEFTKEKMIDGYRSNSFHSKINPKNVLGLISIKTSARPDRRYQQVYEANLIKAIFFRFGGKIKFISVSLHENQRNAEVYASPSIISVAGYTKKESTIDKNFVIKKVEDIEEIVKFFMMN